MENAVVIVMGDRILEVGVRGEIEIPEILPVVEVSGKWIVPGLIDAHIHYFQSGGLYTRPDVIDLRGWRPYETEMARIEADLGETFRRYLASGVTSVVDVGGGYWNFGVRDKANEQLYAPRTAVAGPLVSTVSRPQMDIGDPPIIEVDSPVMARELVRKQLEYDPDLIKIWFIVPRDGNFTPNLPIIEATIDEAHAAGVRVAVHATQLEAARASVKAGADVLVHSVDDEAVDEEFVSLVRESGAIYTSTLIVMEGYGEVLGGNVRMTNVEREIGDPDVVMTWSEVPMGDDAEEIRTRSRARLERTMAVMQKNLKAMQDGGAIIAAGTDAGNIGTLHGPALHREFELMAEAGLTPREILVDATRNAALVFAAEPEMGTIAKGKFADFLILDADPLADIANLQKIHRVVKGGVALDPANILAPSPETVVQRQVEAYNARDIEAFLSFYADDVVVRRLPSGEVAWDSKEAMRPRYAKRFAENPELFCTITTRIVHGDWVVDHELVTGVIDRPRVRAVATYEVKDGLIQNVWFLPVHD
ncbi:MAG: amidohydrolase family protein [Acidobacteria bacterium]|uniref:Amidohydrolase family protein n=1 Tax=Candidatus Sulfomarinibacter kjeldsenii TaxID=2885994 RepID=A0A8J6YC24_9BACT|nr:amidohydrolase family protein [Candidatus Sulfomarinibacter kjeldsenii]